MRYEKIVKAGFLGRDNRFVAEVMLPDGTKQKVHVKNTGRCRELLVEGAAVYLEDFADRMGKRKMRYDLVTVVKETPAGTLMVNMDSQAPNKVVREALENGVLSAPGALPGMGRLALVQGEKTFGDSRFDFYLEDEEGRKAFMEVKGVTLEEDGLASFPDAPTERGRKHLGTLEKALEEGYLAFVLFVIQMRPMKSVAPNDDHDPAFGEALRKAAEKGVKVLAYDCLVEEDSLVLNDPVTVRL